MKKIIDLTMKINESMLLYNAYWHTKVKITQLGKFGKENRETRKLIIGTHSGTHIDAPRHFIKNGNTIDKIPLNKICGKANLLDFSKFPEKTEISLDELKKKLGKTKLNKKVVIRYDWDKRSTKKNYFTHHPFLSPEACKWLVSKKIDLIALDAPQPDNPINTKGSIKDAENHKIFLGNGVLIAEYLINLSKIKNKVFELFICPLKINNGDGSPARCFARV